MRCFLFLLAKLPLKAVLALVYLKQGRNRTNTKACKGYFL